MPNTSDVAQNVGADQPAWPNLANDNSDSHLVIGDLFNAFACTPFRRANHWPGNADVWRASLAGQLLHWEHFVPAVSNRNEVGLLMLNYLKMGHLLIKARQHCLRVLVDNGVLWPYTGKPADGRHRIPKGQDDKLHSAINRPAQ